MLGTSASLSVGIYKKKKLFHNATEVKLFLKDVYVCEFMPLLLYILLQPGHSIFQGFGIGVVSDVNSKQM